MYEGAGIYRHYKGGEYEVLGLGFAERNKEAGFEPTDVVHQQVVYRPLTPGSLLDNTDVSFWLRPLRDFGSNVAHPDSADCQVTPSEIPRFQKIGELA